MAKRQIVSVTHHQPWVRGERLFAPYAELEMMGRVKLLDDTAKSKQAWAQQHIHAAEAVIMVDEILEGLTHDS